MAGKVVVTHEGEDFKVVKLTNRLDPTVGTVLPKDELQKLIDEGTRVDVR